MFEHLTVSGRTTRAGYQVGGQQWDEPHIVTDAVADGGVLVRDSTATAINAKDGSTYHPGYSFVPSAAGVLASAGAGDLPAFTNDPSVHSITLATPLAGASGGTGQSAYTVGDMLYASGAAALSKLAAVAAGMVLVSAGIGVAPAWSATPSLTSLMIGQVAAPATAFQVVETSNSDPRGVLSSQYSSDTAGARIHFRKARGTFAAPTTVVSGDTLGRLRFGAYDGAAFQQMASIDVLATGTIAAGRVPTKMTFSTATDAAPSVLTVALTIDTDQSATFAGVAKFTGGANAAVFGYNPGGLGSDGFGINVGNSGTAKVLYLGGGGQIQFSIGNAGAWNIPSNGNLVPNNDAAVNLGAAAARINHGFFSDAQFGSATSAGVGAIRLGSSDGIYGRNVANSGNIQIITLAGDDYIHIGGSNSAGTIINPDSGAFEVYGGTTPIVARFYRTGSAAGGGANYSRLYIDMGASTGRAIIGTQQAGTGPSLGISFAPGAVSRWLFQSTGDLIPEADATYNFGNSGSRVLSGSFSSYVAIGTNPADAGAVRVANNTAITSRNPANTGNSDLIKLDASNLIVLGAPSASHLKIATDNRTAAAVAGNFTADFYILVYDSAGNNFYIPGRNAAW